jgi:hypothetical protein
MFIGFIPLALKFKSTTKNDKEDLLWKTPGPLYLSESQRLFFCHRGKGFAKILGRRPQR